MSTIVQPIPERYGAVTPYLVVRGAADALAFYAKVFGAIELMRIPGPDGRLGHAEMQIGNRIVMLADEAPQIGARSPEAFGGSPVSLLLYVADVDAVVARAVEAGAKLLHPVEDKFYGDRSGGIADPFGHVWHIATHKEDVSPDELRRRSEALMAGPPKS